MGERFHVEGEIRHHRDVAQLNASLLSQHLPGNDVRVVFHFREDDRVAFLQVGSTPGVGDEVDGFGRAAGDDDLLGVEALLEFRAAGFVAFGGFACEGVDCTVHVGIGLGVVRIHRVNDDLWFLGRRSVVEVDQRIAVHLTLEDGELRSKRHDLTASIRTPNEP